jgi:hypothetical protein
MRVFLFVALFFVHVPFLLAAPISSNEREEQVEAFQQWWGTELEWRFNELPEKGGVPEFRIPYSGHDYPDRAGGTMNALRKYDLAFHRGRQVATSWERSDVGGDRSSQRVWVRGRGLFRNLIAAPQPNVPGWYGHCNGWTSAAIRHAAPERSVVRNGVRFTPADIKGLLAEIYMYTDAQFLGGVDSAINPGTLHVMLANWIGRGSFPIGMEASLGPEKWNYPAYAYTTTFAKRSANRVEVKLNLAYSMSTKREYDRAEHIKRVKYFHYELELDEQGQIIGGVYYRDSSRIDMLWAPLKPAPGGQPGNERGNPHIDIAEVLSIWRESVSESLRSKWFNIDPTDADRIEAEEANTSVSRITDIDGETTDNLTDLITPSGLLIPLD